MRREAAYLTLVLLLMPLSSLVLHSVNGDETSTTSNIIIDGDTDLASSPFWSPVAEQQARRMEMPESLAYTVIGPKTAREIKWIGESG